MGAIISHRAMQTVRELLAAHQGIVKHRHRHIHTFDNIQKLVMEM
jgi:hypothetical protein